MIAVQYSETHMTSLTDQYDGLYAIYAIIADFKLRQQLATTTNVLRFRSGKIAVIRGYFGYVDDTHTYEHINVPDMAI